MKQILIMRHGDSYYHADDFNRPINELGEKSVKKSAKLIKKFKIDKVLCSPSTRTLETLNIIKTEQAITINTDIAITECLYKANKEDILNIVESQPDDIQSLLIVGHNPSLYDFYMLLAKETINEHINKLNLSMPPACVIIIKLPKTTSWSKLSLKSGIVHKIFMP